MVDHSGQPMFLEVEKYFVDESFPLLQNRSLLKDAHGCGMMLAKCKMAYDYCLETCILIKLTGEKYVYFLKKKCLKNVFFNLKIILI